MTKTIAWTLRVSEPLHEKAESEAAKRGMNLSEFIRYAVSVFFDQSDDSNCQDDYNKIEESHS